MRHEKLPLNNLARTQLPATHFLETISTVRIYVHIVRHYSHEMATIRVSQLRNFVASFHSITRHTNVLYELLNFFNWISVT